MKTLASSTSVCTEEDRQLEAAANEKLKPLGSERRIASVFTRTVDNVTIHSVAFRGAAVLIEQSQPFSVLVVKVDPDGRPTDWLERSIDCSQKNQTGATRACGAHMPDLSKFRVRERWRRKKPGDGRQGSSWILRMC